MQFVLILFYQMNFPIAVDTNDQNYPTALYLNSQYYIFWNDLRYYSPDRSIFGARISSDGVVLDPDGVEILRDRTEFLDAAYDGANLLVAIQDSC